MNKSEICNTCGFNVYNDMVMVGCRNPSLLADIHWLVRVRGLADTQRSAEDIQRARNIFETIDTVKGTCLFAELLAQSMDNRGRS